VIPLASVKLYLDSALIRTFEQKSIEFKSSDRTYCSQPSCSSFITSATFLGRPSADALIKAASHMSRYVDPRAPTDISDLKLNELKTDSGMVKYRQLRDNLSRDIRAEFSTIKKSEGTKIHEMYQKAEANLRRQKVKLRSSAFKESRAQFFETIEIRDINEQLDFFTA